MEWKKKRQPVSMFRPYLDPDLNKLFEINKGNISLWF